MSFKHSDDIWNDFPELAAGALHVMGIRKEVAVDAQVAHFEAVARARLSERTEGEFPEIQAWRRAFARMGLKPTQYRSASEALLRRYRKEGALPKIHPMIDLCNAASLAFAIPIAVFDLAKVTGDLEVRPAVGDEIYTTFSGDMERPEPQEIIFADTSGRAHARRWTNRQSGYSAVREETAAVLMVAEALHAGAEAHIRLLVDALREAVGTIWSVDPEVAMLERAAPRFDF
ncbi:DNA/RNA-binding domain of Phe-tRNA-synthetase-like protein [Ensifer sp. WSM1721]|uniref:B3/B4 domain-containing protein n=1 Tax=Ensifer sp. WSM1721 TaxID=1041159 RepID=UPI00047D6DD5|nr:phenylalanine--tRNA ligase beta subunit-related protein [Ensifer sp. WSM1721]